MKTRYSYIQLIDGKVHCGPIADLEAFLESSIKFKFILKRTETDNIDSYSKLPFIEVVYLDKKLKNILPTVGTFTILTTENYQIWSSVRHFRVSVCDVNGDSFSIYLTSDFGENTVKELYNALLFINKFSSTTELKEYLQMEDKKGLLYLSDILKHTKENTLEKSSQIISEELLENVSYKLKDIAQINPWQEIIGLAQIKTELERDPVNFGNARGVRKIFERVERNQNLRPGKMPNPTNAELLTITMADIKFS